MMQKGRVLVVDDEADIRELLAMTLQRMGLDADCAACERDAVGLLQSHSYDLCLTGDMRLPDGDGLQIIEHVGRHCPATPVAVITAHGSAENAVAALKAGALARRPENLEIGIEKPNSGSDRLTVKDAVRLMQ